MTDKYTRDFSNFGEYPWPGKNMPEYYDWKVDAGDGNGGIQWMIHNALSTYGPRHVIEGIDIQTGAANSVTGTAGYYMWDGQIRSTSGLSGVIAANQYAYISGNNDGLYFTNTGTLGDNTGVIIAISGIAGIKNVTQRWDKNKLLYLYVDRVNASQLTGATAQLGSTEITGTFGLSSNAIIVGGLDVDGYTNIDNTSITGTLGVVGNTEITGTVGMSTTLDVEGAVDFTSTLNVQDAVTFQTTLDMTAGNINNINDLDVNGAIDCEGNIDVNGTANLDEVDIDNASAVNIAGDLDVVGDLDVDGIANLDVTDIDGTLNVLGAVTFQSTLNMDSGNVNNVNDLDVNGSIDCEGNLDVNGTSNLDTTDIDGSLNVSSTFDLYGTLDMNDGAITKVGTLQFNDGGATVTNIVNSDSLGTSDTVLCTQGNTKAYVDGLALGGDLSGTPSAAVVGNNSHTHNSTTISYGLDHAFDYMNYIDGADSYSNSMQIGDVSSRLRLWAAGLTAHVSSNGALTLGGAATPAWVITSATDMYPENGNFSDIGTASKDVAYIYYCNLSDTSCADFSHKTADELYNMFAQIQPRTDDIVHKSKDRTYKHVDFATIPDDFMTKAKEDFTKERVYKAKSGKKAGKLEDAEETTLDYKEGDNCGIELNTYVYAMKDLLVKSYEKIQSLETRLAELENA